ncbi:response regulator transcription factor [Oscillatoria acuminata]|uniref:Response regulator containing a CheY-like receiver domain and an HTH DNA-binding domain n=1 Tax=Oscillatoria acuminata PCC 6304 TaxID=56110 RepID=K9TIE6_9CYAN|nr:response regulator [Oscillatoria acuminata]AFY82183.1 response regulator containing a CheY-like receiver domain and an HTH DNA-binding domain [Oscillatoria acuminata PCC 6304]
MKSILLVEDDVALRGNLTEYLEELGYLVLEASSGLEGLEIFDRQSPDLIISDVMMPSMDGLEFCRRLRSSRQGQLVPFLFLSGQNELEDRLKGHKMGADDYIVKPFNSKEIVAKIENLLERSLRLHQEILRVLDRVKAPEAPANPSPSQDPEKLPLTPAEAKVFAEVIEGGTNKEIGARLFLSDRTVQAHLTKILKKLNLKNRNELIRFAWENGYRAVNLQPE